MKAAPEKQGTGSKGKTQQARATASLDLTIGCAVTGCLAAGGVGVIKACGMTSGSDVLLCLLGSAAAFGAAFYFCLGRR